MNSVQRITSVHFSRYKAFRDFSIALQRFNILVGPNNCGKSTILSVFRILAEAIRKAKSKSATLVEGPNGETRGYSVGLGSIPVATENIFNNYNDDQPARVTFRMSSGDSLMLFFPKRGICNLICETSGRPITSPSSFRQRFCPEIGYVPILGPVEHEERLFQKEAAREALLTHRASRNFRNIWHHYPDAFDEFRNLVQTTWPGMDVKRPEIDTSHEKPLLRMFCPEERIDREIYWSGFGFQVWCQMLTFLVANRDSSLFIIDEPDIYLHSDLQRQLVAILKDLGPDIVIATHSTEIITEADPNEVLVVSKKGRSAKRVSDPAQLRSIFETLGSNLNPFLTQVARSKRLVFVEGEDFRILAPFASKLAARAVAIRSEFAIVQARGFNPTRVKTFAEGVEAALASRISVALVFDRDYRSESEVANELASFRAFCDYAHIHSKKELENFLLVPDTINRAITQAITEQNRRTGRARSFSDNISTLLSEITDSMKHDVQAQYLKRQLPFERTLARGLDDATVTSALLAAFDERWRSLEARLDMVPGKAVLSVLNEHLQKTLGVTITPRLIIDAMLVSEIAPEMKEIITALEQFSRGGAE
jgi:energy-coupling factor transporter ATP-binding protein EcfA2